MEVLTFDQLPKAVSELLEKVSKIEDILSHDHANEQDDDSFFSIKQASAFLNLSISTIYGKVCRREIPVSKQGRNCTLIKWSCFPGSGLAGKVLLLKLLILFH